MKNWFFARSCLFVLGSNQLIHHSLYNTRTFSHTSSRSRTSHREDLLVTLSYSTGKSKPKETPIILRRDTNCSAHHIESERCCHCFSAPKWSNHHCFQFSKWLWMKYWFIDCLSSIGSSFLHDKREDRTPVIESWTCRDCPMSLLTEYSIYRSFPSRSVDCWWISLFFIFLDEMRANENMDHIGLY